MNTLIVFLQTQIPSQSGSTWSSLIFIVFLIVIFWLFFIRPKKKKNQVSEQFPIQPRADNAYNQAVSLIDQPASQSFSFCPSCGSKLKEGAKFCSGCGNAVSTVGQLKLSTKQFNQTAQTVHGIANVYIKGNQLTRTQRVLNLVSANQLIDTFSYSNGMLSIKTQGEKSLYAPLSQCSTYFQYIPATKQRFVTIKYQNTKIEFAEVPDSISTTETNAIFDILLKAGTTYDAESISPEGIATANQIHKIKQQAAITTQISKQISYNPGYRMGQMMRRW